MLLGVLGADPHLRRGVDLADVGVVAQRAVVEVGDAALGEHERVVVAVFQTIVRIVEVGHGQVLCGGCRHLEAFGAVAAEVDHRVAVGAALERVVLDVAGGAAREADVGGAVA